MRELLSHSRLIFAGHGATLFAMIPWRPTSLLRAFALAPVIALLVSVVARANPECPQSVMRLNSTSTFTSTEPVFDSLLVTPFGSFRTTYDLLQGTVHMDQCCSLNGAEVTASDLFDLSGVPPGTVVSGTVEFTVDGAVSTTACGGTGCSGSYGAVLRHGDVTDSRSYSIHLFNGREEHHDVLVIPLTLTAGQPERVDFNLWGHRNVGGSHASEATGVYRFRGFGSGVRVVSCQGAGAQVTPVRRPSWGALKAIYR